MTALYGRLPPALDELLRQRLEALGWSLFGFGSPIGRTWTFPVSDDLVATLAVYGPWHFHTPAAFTVDVGVGHPPSTRLMPRLTQQPRASLYSIEDQPWLTWEAEDPDDPETQTSFAAAVTEMARFAVDAAGRLSQSGLLERQLRELAPDEDDPTTLPLYLAATGRVNEALETIEESVGRDGAWRNWSEDQDRRLARQLRLWADAGAPTPPELDKWPPNAFDAGLIEVDEGSTWSRARARSRAEREAQEAVRKALRTPPADSSDTAPAAQQVAHMLRREYGQRDVPLSPGRALQQAEFLLLEREPLGRWRVGMSVLSQLPGVVRQLAEAAREVRGTFTEDVLSDETPAADPELEAPWPEDALFDFPPDSDSWVEVAVDATTADALRKTATQPDGSTKQFLRLRVWVAAADTVRREAAGQADPSVPHGSLLVGTGHVVLGHFPPGSAGPATLRSATPSQRLLCFGRFPWQKASSDGRLTLRDVPSRCIRPRKPGCHRLRCADIGAQQSC